MTKSITASILNLLGDVTCQTLVEGKPIGSASFDMRRTAVFTALGLVLIGPSLHLWYSTLSHFIVGAGPAVAIKKLLADQFLFAPIFMATILGSISIAEGASKEETLAKVKAEWAPVLKANWKFWLPCNVRLPCFADVAANW